MRIFEPEIKECPVCGRFLCKKYDGALRTVMTLKGSIEAQEHVKQCKKKTCPNYGRDIELHIARAGAARSAGAYLAGRGVRVDEYHHATWLVENVDPLTLRYFLEHLSIRE